MPEDDTRQANDFFESKQATLVCSLEETEVLNGVLIKCEWGACIEAAECSVITNCLSIG